MLETSKDILNLAMAISIFGLAFLVGWILVYFLIIIRRMVKIMEGVEDSMKKISEFVSLAKSKLENSASYLSILATGARELVNYFVNKSSQKKSRKK